MQRTTLKQKATDVLKHNDVGDWTRPAPDLYPHQWLWDSAFISIGLRHVDVKKAQREILSIFRGQWSNGMIPHMVFAERTSYRSPTNLWRSTVSPYAPDNYDTSGITQPPMLAEAIVQIGKKLNAKDRKKWYRKVYPYLVDYHMWMYRDRNPHAEGLVVLIHPWETGLDNTPPWMIAMHEHQRPLWIKVVAWLKIDKLIEQLRRDTRQVPPDERMTTLESLMLVNVVRRLRRKQYDIEHILSRSHFIIEDIFFNSILMKANHHLMDIANELKETLPDELVHFINVADKSIEELWDDEDGWFYSRTFLHRHFIKEPTIASLMPLYAGTISKKRASQLVAQMHDNNLFGTNFPVPSVPLSSKYFDQRRYWQGPTWVNTNWLLIKGLENYGFDDEAKALKTRTIEMVDRSGFFEYFSPIDGYGAGIAPFSWTAALILDLIED